MNGLQERIAYEVGIAPEQVGRVLELFALETHRTFYELEHDPLVELRFNSSPMVFFHFLGVLRAWAEDTHEEHFAEEYLCRLGPASDWQPFSDQMADWKRPEER